MPIFLVAVPWPNNQDARSESLEGLIEYFESVSDEEFDGEGAEPRDLFSEEELFETTEDEPELQPPSVVVTMTLVDLVIDSGIYRVVLRVDPQLTPEHPSDEYSLWLKGNDNRVSVTYSANNGTIRLRAKGSSGTFRSGPAFSGKLLSPVVPELSHWTVTVSLASGNPEYELGCDIVVAL